MRHETLPLIAGETVREGTEDLVVVPSVPVGQQHVDALRVITLAVDVIAWRAERESTRPGGASVQGFESGLLRLSRAAWRAPREAGRSSPPLVG